MSSEAESASSRREAIKNAIEERHETIKNDREKNYEKKHENTILVKSILDGLEAAEKDLRIDLAGIKDVQEHGLELTEALDRVAVQMKEFEKLFGQQISLLPNYEVKRFQNTVIELTILFMETQEQLQPKKKFGFKGNKKKNKNKTTEEEAAAAQETTPSEPKPFQEMIVGFEIKDRSDEEAMIRVDPEQIHQKDVLLKGLTRCKVFLLSLIHI